MNDVAPAPTALPEDLELMSPGPELAAVLATVDRRALSGADRLRLARVRNRQVAFDQAELCADIYATSWAEPADDGGPVEPEQASRYPWSEVELAFAMRWTRTAAGGRLEQARQLAEDFPALLAALRAGVVDMPKVLVIGELAGWLDDLDTARRLVDRALEKAPQQTTGELRARMRKLVLAVDPQAARKRCATALTTRRVETAGNPDGTGEVWGRNLPPQDAAAAWERLTAIARAARAAGDSRSIDQLRADALLDLLVGDGIALGEPVGEHVAGLPEARGRPDPTGGEPAAAGQGDARDPVWPTAPFEPIGPHDVWPAPSGQPVDRFDDAGQEFDGPMLWPPDWPGRWVDDPAVRAAAGNGPPSGARDPAKSEDTAKSKDTASEQCARCARPAAALPAPRRGTVELQVPLLTLLQLAEHPGDLAGWGPVVADIAAQIATRQADGTWRFAVTNELGEVGWTGITRQRPTAGTAAHVLSRDHTCVAPGCRHPARSCDLDHTIGKARRGHSGRSNLGCLCRMHHRFKGYQGTHLIQFGPGTFGWTTPRGLQYTRRAYQPLHL